MSWTKKFQEEDKTLLGFSGQSVQFLLTSHMDIFYEEEFIIKLNLDRCTHIKLISVSYEKNKHEEKILTSKFYYVVALLRTKNINALLLEKFQSSLLVHEKKMNHN